MADATTLARKVATHVNEKQLFAVLQRKSPLGKDGIPTIMRKKSLVLWFHMEMEVHS